MVKILCDFDQTLADTETARLAAINREFGTNYKSHGITTWNNSESLYMDADHESWGWGEECFLNEDFQAALKPIDGAIEGMYQLLNEGHSPMIVSDRPPSLFEVTRDWLDRQGLDIVRLLFTRHKHSIGATEGDGRLSKTQAAYRYRLTTVIEDAPHHSINLAEKNYIKHIFLLDKPYNQQANHLKIKRVKGWNEIHVE